MRTVTVDFAFMRFLASPTVSLLADTKGRENNKNCEKVNLISASPMLVLLLLVEAFGAMTGQKVQMS
jgi:hypothetical protein